MTHAAEFARLEQFVEKLVAGYNSLKTECAELQNRIQQLREENEELTDTLAGLRQERQDIHSRVSGLIGKIESWEQGEQGGEETDAAEETDRQNTASLEQGRIFAATDPPDSEASS